MADQENYLHSERTRRIACVGVAVASLIWLGIALVATFQPLAVCSWLGMELMDTTPVARRGSLQQYDAAQQTLEITTTAHQIQEYHHYIRLAGEQSLAWFFFASTINAATAGWLFQSKRVLQVKYVPVMFLVCDFALAWSFAALLPGIYHQYAELIRAGLAESGVTLPPATPHALWSKLAITVSGVFVMIGGMWCYFFFTATGRKRLESLTTPVTEKTVGNGQ